VVRKVPITVMTRRICIRTNGAFRLTLPMAPPTTMTSVVTAPKVMRKNKIAEIQKRGWRS
jgi:hypothetical protein